MREIEELSQYLADEKVWVAVSLIVCIYGVAEPFRQGRIAPHAGRAHSCLSRCVGCGNVNLSHVSRTLFQGSWMQGFARICRSPFRGRFRVQSSRHGRIPCPGGRP